MAKREGNLGKLLADGVKRASERLGKGSEKFALHVKGMEGKVRILAGLDGNHYLVGVVPVGYPRGEPKPEEKKEFEEGTRFI